MNEAKTMSNEEIDMKVYELSLIGEEQLKSMYSVYVIVLKYKNKKYFYIGQTGCKSHKIARPPFLRLAGHLGKQESSMQNQIYKGIMEKVLKIEYDEDTYRKVESCLSKMHLTMYTFPIEDFKYDIDDDKHKENRQKMEEIEKILIIEFKKEYDEANILNIKSGKIKDNSKIDKINKAVEDIKRYIFAKEPKKTAPQNAGLHQPKKNAR